MDKAADGFTNTCERNVDETKSDNPTIKNRSRIFNLRTKNVPITAKMKALFEMLSAGEGFVQ
ncbi:MAG: hypothetical protein ACK5FT_00375 [Sphingomonadales bacterium]